MKEKISDYKARCEAGLRRTCGRISPRRRMAVVVGLCLIFGIVNTCMLVSAANDLERGEGQRTLDAGHIQIFDPAPSTGADSLNTSGDERPAGQ